MKIYKDVFSGEYFESPDHFWHEVYHVEPKMFGISSDIQFNIFDILCVWLTFVEFRFSGDELFSDTYKITLKDNVLYEVVGKVRP